VYNWTSTAPLALPELPQAKNLMEFAHINYKGKHVVYGTYQDNVSWRSLAFEPFSDWSEMATANQTRLPISGVAAAPQIFYFRPKNIWILAYQWGQNPFEYRTSSDPSNLNGWSEPKPLWRGTIPQTSMGAVDPHLISDGQNMHLFFGAGKGAVYRVSMPIEKFPGDFGVSWEVVLQDKQTNVFDGIQVYRVKGQDKYLMLVNAMGVTTRRYSRSLTAPSLDGPWTPHAATEANPFASVLNSNATWSLEVNQGRLLRSTNDETMTVDPCDLKLLFQGRVPSSEFSLLAWRPALLTLLKK
jgi:hypothetical protein